MAEPHEDREAALRAWLERHNLVGEFARGGRSSATLLLFWHRRWVPGFDPPVPDWFKEHPGEDQGERTLARMGLTAGQIATARADRRSRRR